MEFALERETLSVPGPEAASSGSVWSAFCFVRSVLGRGLPCHSPVCPHRRKAILRAPSLPLPGLALVEPLARLRPTASAPPFGDCQITERPTARPPPPPEPPDAAPAPPHALSPSVLHHRPAPANALDQNGTRSSFLALGSPPRRLPMAGAVPTGKTSPIHNISTLHHRLTMPKSSPDLIGTRSERSDRARRLMLSPPGSASLRPWVRDSVSHFASSPSPRSHADFSVSAKPSLVGQVPCSGKGFDWDLMFCSPPSFPSCTPSRPWSFYSAAPFAPPGLPLPPPLALYLCSPPMISLGPIG